MLSTIPFSTARRESTISRASRVFQIQGSGVKPRLGLSFTPSEMSDTVLLIGSTDDSYMRGIQDVTTHFDGEELVGVSSSEGYLDLRKMTWDDAPLDELPAAEWRLHLFSDDTAATLEHIRD